MKGIEERRVRQEACPRACSRHSGISPDAIAGRPARSDSTMMMPAIVSTMATPAVAAVSKLRILAQDEPVTVRCFSPGFLTRSARWPLARVQDSGKREV